MARRTIPAVLDRLRQWAHAIKRDVHALYLAARDSRVPWYAKFMAGCVAAYALSPVDLIPDFIPVLGYLDDLVIVPAGIVLALRMIPAEVMAEHRATAAASGIKPVSRIGLAVIVALWIALAAAAGWLVYRWYRS